MPLDLDRVRSALVLSPLLLVTACYGPRIAAVEQRVDKLETSTTVHETSSLAGRWIHPQGASFRSGPVPGTNTPGPLEAYAYFDGTVTDGVIVSPDPTKIPLVGWIYMKDGTIVRSDVVAKRIADDPCPDKRGDSSKAWSLPRYEVSTPGGANLCDGQPYLRTSDEKACDGHDSELKGTAVAIPGYWDPVTETYYPSTPAAPRFSLSCYSGVIAKCAHWGYAPWRAHPHDGQKTLEPHYRACVLAARAMFDGKSHTENNTPVTFYDSAGVQKWAAGLTKFEAVWDENGCVCGTDEPRLSGCKAVPAQVCRAKACAGDPKDTNTWPGLLATWHAQSQELCPIENPTK